MKKTKKIPGREIPKWKKDAVKKLASDIDKSKVVALVNMELMPAHQLQRIRSKLKKNLTLVMTKKAIILRALKGSKKKTIAELTSYIKGMPAVLLTDMDPFELSVTLDKERVPAPIKGSAVAEDDIVVHAGITPFTPGPVIAELAGVGIKTKVEAGKLTVVSDTTVVKAGETVSEPLAAILKRLGIKPVKVGLNLVAAWEDGHVYHGEVLQVSQDGFIKRIQTAHQSAVNLAYSSNIVTSETAVALLSKASSNAQNLAVNLAVLNDETKAAVLAVANSHAYVLAHLINEKDSKALSEALSKHLAEIGIKEVFGGK